MSCMELRPYQQEALAAVERELAARRSTLVVMPTGSGKTVVFAAAAERFRGRGRVLVIAHREELLEQAADKIQRATALSTGIEQAERRVARLFLPDVVIASVQTLARAKRRETFRPEEFALVVVDEAHHAAAASYRDILDYFRVARVLGVTATPDRSDAARLVPTVFESIAYRYSIRTAIRDGWLVPIRQCRVRVDGLDLSSVRTTAGDLNEGDLERVLTASVPLQDTARRLVQAAGERRTMVFSATVAHARALAAAIAQYEASGGARAIDGEASPDERVGFLADFRAGVFRHAVNCQMYTEGFDEPTISCVAMVRPTKSRSLYTQAAGRGLRLSPETGKKDLLLLDFCGNAGRHALVEAVDLLVEDDAPKARERAKKILAKEPQLTLLEALVRAEREAAHPPALALPAQPDFRLEAVNPFVSLETTLGFRLPVRHPDAPRATDRQVEALEVGGVDMAKLGVGGLDLRQASAVLDAISRRRAAGLCSLKQLKLLERFGHEDAARITSARACVLIQQLRAAGWRRPGRAGGSSE